LRKLSPTLCAVLLAGAVCAPVFTAGSASAAPCPPPGSVPAAPAPLDAPVEIILSTVYVYAHC
jgi:hypothetical protein